MATKITNMVNATGHFCRFRNLTPLAILDLSFFRISSLFLFAAE
jgi:hypothetical protein